MTDYPMTINGKLVTSESTFAVVNPATEEVIAEVPCASEQHVDDAVSSARAALSAWAKDESVRRELLGKMHAILQDNREQLATILTREQGKPLANAKAEINSAIAGIRTRLEHEIPVDKLVTKEQRTTHVMCRPIGVTAIITPWNYPLSIAVGNMVSALLLGNTVVVKPAPTTSITTLMLGTLFGELFPAGVINIISGSDQVGEYLVRHRDIAKISFTGSVATGRKIAQIAAQDFKRVTLELGGNDPAIVLGDVKVSECANSIFWGAFANCGQICVAIKRLYVHRSVVEPVVTQLTELARKVVVGDGEQPGVELGPLNNKQQLAIVQELVSDAVNNGATVHCGGERLGSKGYFYQPTIISGIKEGVRLIDEEQFGPVLPVMVFDSEEEVIERANKTSYGLGASVWSQDVHKAQAIAEQLQAGNVWINHMFGEHHSAPFGGFKHSGIGRTGGKWGIQGMAEIQAITVPN